MEAENDEIRRKMAIEQKKLKERSDKRNQSLGKTQKKKEKPPQPEESKDERLARMAKEKTTTSAPKKRTNAA